MDWKLYSIWMVFMIFLSTEASGNHTPSDDADCPSKEARRNDGLSIECGVKLDALTYSIAELSRCVTKAAWPLRSCTSCYQLREDIDRAYDDLMKENTSRSRCSHELMDWDKVGALDLAYGYYTQLTRLTRCDLCLDPLPGGGYALKPTVERAMASYGYVIGCFKELFPAEKKINASAVVCDFCRESYRQFSSDMAAIVINPDDWQTCRDVMDMGNRTWHLWVQDHCDYVPLDWGALTSNFVLIAVAVFTFYFGVYVCNRDADAGPEDDDEGRRKPRGPKHLYTVDALGGPRGTKPPRRFTR